MNIKEIQILDKHKYNYKRNTNINIVIKSSLLAAVADAEEMGRSALGAANIVCLINSTAPVCSQLGMNNKYKRNTNTKEIQRKNYCKYKNDIVTNTNTKKIQIQM